MKPNNKKKVKEEKTESIDSVFVILMISDSNYRKATDQLSFR